MENYTKYIRNPNLIEKFNAFKLKYRHLYTEASWELIEREFYKSLRNEGKTDILMQIYSELGLIAKGSSFYIRHLKLLKELFPLDGNILEVGSGRIPAFANMIANEQLRINKGTITIYEPLLLQILPKRPNMLMHKEEFTLDTDVSKYDLLVGILPCSITETLIESACRNRKNFYVAMCGCINSSSEYSNITGITRELYQELIIDKTKSLIKKYDNGHLEITKLKNNPINYPILYNKK